ncbi:hypothetical protein [Emticicia sp. 21SJ11W-3]|uniref:hypothetical protein n=1 Tax=Emticicia sp. 21SJ11W-3 TaxID=2916755 RepID=UPI0020A22165|nr:hypothetical protein [Emticicia sp. 21SJ11W-3]UTA66523.1 hypothetical protein MB380_13030 [Emticicia sp. 21SJ11W-3]
MKTWAIKIILIVAGIALINLLSGYGLPDYARYTGFVLLIGFVLWIKTGNQPISKP